MRSGCPHSQGGFYSACQHWSNVGARSFPQAINVPVVHPENEMQNNMVASQNPGDHGVAYGPALLQKSDAQLQQNSQELNHQQELLASTVSTGSQPSILINTTTNFCTSAHVSVQHSSYLGTSVGYSVRQSFNNSGQPRECSRVHFRRRFLKESNLNQNTGLQQRKHLNCAFSTGTNSAALQRDGLKVAQTVPLKVQHYSETLQKTCPSDSESFTTKSPSEETNVNMSLNTVAHVSGRRHHKGQQVKDSLAALNCEQTRTHQHHSGGTPSTPHQQQVSSPSVSLQPSTDKVLSVGERKPPTNDEIHAIISKKLAYFCNYLIQKKRSDGHSNELGRDSILKSCLATTSASKEEDTMIEECSAAVGQSNCLALEEDNSKGVTLMPRFKEKGDCATAASEKHSTEYPHIMPKVAATCTKNEEESPVVLAAVPGMTWDDAMREKKPTLVLNRSSSQEEYKSPSLNGNKNVDDIDQVPGVSWAFNHMTERKKGDAARKPVGTVGLDSVQGMIDVAEDPQTKSSPVVSGNGTFGFSSLINRNAKQKKSIEDQQHVSENLGSAPSQTNLRISVPENKFQKHAQRCESKVEEARQLFKDSSDNDVLQLATELPTKEPWECSSPACVEVLQYEDISDAESQIESVPVETTIPTQLAAPNDRQSPFENTGDGHVQGQAKVTTETLVIAQHCSLCFVEIDDCSESKCGCGRQTKPSVSYSPSSVLSDLLSDDDTTNDEMDDDHLVIPIGIFDLRYEPEEEDQDSPETNLPSPKRCPSPNHVRSSAFPPVLVFDTWEHLLKAEEWKSIIDVSFEHEMDSEGDVETLQKRRGSSDSCGTDDSFDYPSTIKPNYMTVSNKMLSKGLAPVPSKTDDSLPSPSSSDNEVTNMQEDQTWGMDKPIEAKAVSSKCLQGEYIIIVDSDTEDESKKCKKQTKRKRLRSSGSGDSVDSQCSQQKRHSPDTFKEKISLEKSVILINSEDEDDPAQNYEMPRFSASGLHKGDAPCVPLESVEGECGPAEETRPSSADSPQRQSKRHEPQFREVTEAACSDVLHSEQLVEASGGSDHVPHKAKRQKTPRRVIPDSEMVLKKGHFSKRKSVTKEIFSSEDSGGDDLIASKSRPIESVVRLCKTANTKSLSSEDLPEKQPQSVMKDADSHLPNAHVIPRYIVECSGSKGGLKLVKEPVVHKRGKDGPRSPEASTAASKKIESCDKNKAPFYRNKKVRFSINDKNQATNNVQDDARKPPRVSRQLSLHVQEGPSTSFSSLSSTSRHLPVARQRSRSWNPSEASCLPYNPRELSFPPNRPRPCSSSSTLKHPPSKGPASTLQLNSTGYAMEQVNSYHPIRGDSRLREDHVRPERHRHDRARDDRAPRKRHNPPKPATILMKRATNEAIQLTKAIHRVSSKERRDSVGEGYKWSEKSTKGSSREEEKKDRSPPRHYL